MFLAQLWVCTILILPLHHPLIITAMSASVDNKFDFCKDNKKVSSSTVERRAFSCDVVTLIIIVFAILNTIMYKLRELHEASYTEQDQTFLQSSGKICRRFSLAEILLATNNFDDKCLIGKGGSAKVYKGVINNGATTVAVKRLSFISKQAVGSMFRTEIEMLSKFRHSHLVSLLGYCHEWHEMILVFEYISHGTLSDHLHQSFVKVCSDAKNLCYNENKDQRVDSRVNQNKVGILAESYNRRRLNKIGIVPEVKGLLATVNLRTFSLAELGSATRGFSPDMILGENNYGKAFIGWLDEDTLAPSRIGIGMAVGIKSINSYGRYITMQAEVDLCGRFYHPNVLKPLGFCSEDQEFLLVYEYTAKGNVARYAYKDNGKSLSWIVWLKILIGAARYLDFLHSSDDHIIFGDFTLSSILLDWDFTPKIGLSGNARFGPEDGDALITAVPNLSTQHCAGSEGYLSPEYKEAGRLSSKNDVYAFGVVLLEILTGMRVIDVNTRNKKSNLVDKARPVLGCERKVKRVVNPKLLEQENCPKVVKSILSDVPALALKCLDFDPKKRPSMRQVVETLERVNAIIH